MTNDAGQSGISRATAATIAALFALGVFLRVRQYVYNRSLWLDEAMISLNIVERPLAQLFGQLDMNQAAPPGFLAVEKLFCTLLGPSDFVLRLFPLVCSIAALALIAPVALRTSTGAGAVVATALMAFNEKLIHFSGEVKQYSTDTLVSVGLLHVVLRPQNAVWRGNQLVLLGLTGAVAVWFSHPSVFILAAVGLYLLVLRLRLGVGPKLFQVAALGLSWAVSFGLHYVLVLKATTGNSMLQGFWDNYFMPFPPQRAEDLRWFLHYPFLVFRDPMGFHMSGLAAGLFGIGCLMTWSQRASRPYVALLLGPVVITLVASGLHLYPFGLRLLLFLVPILTLGIAHGASGLTTAPAAHGVRGLVVFLLLMHPVIESSYHVRKPRMVQEVKTVIAFMRETDRTAKVYVHRGALPAFRFYSREYGFDPMSVTYGSAVDEKGSFQRWLSSQEQGTRYWLVFSHFAPGRDVPTIQEHLRVAASRGTEVTRRVATSAWAILLTVES